MKMKNIYTPKKTLQKYVKNIYTPKKTLQKYMKKCKQKQDIKTSQQIKTKTNTNLNQVDQFTSLQFCCAC
jgi:DUF438 domain-containing protein